MAHVLLIRPSLGDFYRFSLVRPAVSPSPPLNLALLAAVLEQHGHRVTVSDLEVTPSSTLPSTLRSHPPHLVGVTFRTPQLGAARELATRIKRHAPDALLVAGGPHPSVRARQTVASTPYDVVVRGEGEHAILALASGTPRRDIPGLTWSDGETPAGPAPNLDSLPLPAWHLFELAKYQRPSLVARHTPVADVESSRGCPGRCPYCTKGVFGVGFRPLSPRRTVDAMEHALAHGFNSVNFVDDAMTTDLPRARAICHEILRRGLAIPWTCTNGLRVAQVDREFFQLARRAGCRLVGFGLESGSQRVLDAIHKGASLEQGRVAVAHAHAAGIATLGYFMLGLPTDSVRSMEDTIRFAKELDLDYAKFSITMPLPGTPLYDLWRPHMRDPEHWDFSIHRSARAWFRHPTLSWRQIEHARNKAYLGFYGRPRWWASRLRAGPSPRRSSTETPIPTDHARE